MTDLRDEFWQYTSRGYKRCVKCKKIWTKNVTCQWCKTDASLEEKK